MSYIKFSECLTSLLSILDISANRLSKAINVDSSLVNRWVNGKRIPGYDSIHIQTIADYFAKNILNSIQAQRLNELFARVCGSHGSASNQKEKIFKLLLEAQGYSIECKRKNLINKKNLFDVNELTHSVALSDEDQIIFRKEKIFSAAISLLETAIHQKCGNHNTIYITYHNDRGIENQNLIDGLREAILKAINHGWNIILLLRLNHNIDRTIELIKFAKPLIRTGKFAPYYINQYDASAIGRENFTVPEIGVLSCFSTKPSSEINCAFYLKNKVAIEIFQNYYQTLLPNYARPLIHYYPPEDRPSFNHCLIKSEENIGNRFQYNYCASPLTLPEQLYVKLLKKKRSQMMR